MSAVRAISVGALAVLVGGQSAGASLQSRIAAHVDTETAALVAIRRDLHRHPELSGEEKRTAGIVAARLKALGLQVRTGIGGHGVVGILTGGRPGTLVAYRADMDAVRSPEPDPVEFKSLIDGVRHICGHDVHVAIGLGLASALASVRADLPGRVMPGGFAPGVTNDAALFASSRADLVAAMGEAAFEELRQLPPGVSEDFGHFQSRAPGVFFFLGVGAAGWPHKPDYVADEAAIPFGVKAMAAVVVGRLRNPPG
jgi:metal-dependent amidase/aminoacylase/carboxypeptidase family protein